MQPNNNRPPVPERHTRQHHDHEDAQLHAEHKNPNDSLMNEDDNDSNGQPALQPLTRRGNWGNQSGEQAEPNQPPSATKQGWNSQQEEKTNDQQPGSSSPNAIAAPRFGRRQGGVANNMTMSTKNNANQYDLDVGEDDTQQSAAPVSYPTHADDTHIDSDAPAARVDHVAGLNELNDQYNAGGELPSMLDSVDVSLLLSTIIPSTVNHQQEHQQHRSPYEEVDEPWDYQRLFAELSMQLQKKPQKTVDDDEPDDDAAVVAPGKR